MDAKLQKIVIVRKNVVFDFTETREYKHFSCKIMATAPVSSFFFLSLRKT